MEYELICETQLIAHKLSTPVNITVDLMTTNFFSLDQNHVPTILLILK